MFAGGFVDCHIKAVLPGDASDFGDGQFLALILAGFKNAPDLVDHIAQCFPDIAKASSTARSA